MLRLRIAMISPFNYSFSIFAEQWQQGWMLEERCSPDSFCSPDSIPITLILLTHCKCCKYKKKKIETSIQIERRFDMHCVVAGANAAAAERKTKAVEAAGLEAAWGQREVVGAARSQMLRQKVSGSIKYACCRFPHRLSLAALNG